jgi:hypothetical protein
VNLVRCAPGAENINALKAMHGHPYDFNAHPIKPLDMRVVAHDKQCTTRGAYGLDGRYVGSAPDYYRGASIYFPSTRRVRVSESISLHIHIHDLVTESCCTANRLEKAISNITNLISAIHPRDIRPTTVEKIKTCSIVLLEPGNYSTCSSTDKSTQRRPTCDFLFDSNITADD